MGEHITIAFHLAWFVAVWHMLVAGYLIFVAERNDALLMGIALTKAVLGATIYVVIREPEWFIYSSIRGLLVPLILALLLVISFVITWLLWQHYNLDTPCERYQRWRRNKVN